MSTITPETLDKLDRFRSQAIIDIKSLELPADLAVELRQGLSRFIDKTIDNALQVTTTAPINQPVNSGVEF
jgi:hypothetical protein